MVQAIGTSRRLQRLAALIVAFAACLSAGNLPAAVTPDEAFATAQKTGKPIFAIAMTRSCPYCVQLLEALKTDKTLQPLAAEFVPLVIDVSAAPYWNAWRAKYPANAGVPKLYFVRPDGELIDLHSGWSGVNGTYERMNDALQKSIPTETLAKVSEAMTRANEMLASNDVIGAAQEMAPFSGVNSQVKVLQEAKALLETIGKKASEEIAAAEKKLKNKETAFEGAMLLTEAYRNFASLPEQKKSINVLLTKYRKYKPTATVMTQAESLSKAGQLEVSKGSERAIKAYQVVINNHPNTPAAKYAGERIASLGGESGTETDPAAANDAAAATPESDSGEGSSKAKAETATDEADGLRTWKDASGKFTVKARLLDREGENVLLQTEAGKTIRIAIGKLSDDDRKHLNSDNSLAK